MKELVGSDRLGMAVGWMEMLTMVGILGGAFLSAAYFDFLVGSWWLEIGLYFIGDCNGPGSFFLAFVYSHTRDIRSESRAFYRTGFYGAIGRIYKTTLQMVITWFRTWRCMVLVHWRVFLSRLG